MLLHLCNTPIDKKFAIFYVQLIEWFRDICNYKKLKALFLSFLKAFMADFTSMKQQEETFISKKQYKSTLNKRGLDDRGHFKTFLIAFKG